MKLFNSSSQNEKEMNKKLIEYKNYFDEMFKEYDPNIVLDDQQRKAVLMDADNLLVIAGAGSGKTTTMIAKVKYLIDKCGYKPKEIAVLSFTRKVTEEIEKILHGSFGLIEVNISTFHKLGLEILKKADENKNIEGIADDKSRYSVFSNYIKNELYEDKEKFGLFVNAFNKFLYFSDEWKNYSHYSDYHKFKFNNKLLKSEMNLKTYNEDQIKRRRNYKKTIRGEYLNSKEEVDIANFLYVNGIEYEYEKRFNKPNVLLRPDFFINQLEKENYIEHFGIDQRGGCNDSFTETELNSYLKNMNIKKQYYNQVNNKGLFIITYSKYNNEDTYLNSLKKQLLEKGYQFKQKTDEEIYDILAETSQDSYITKFIEKLLIPFIDLFKLRGFDDEQFIDLINQNKGMLKDQLTVLRDFYLIYEKKLDERNLIDFNDMISKAYKIIPKLKEKDFGVDYKYLIIDEYQDISSQRFNLVERFSALFNAKIMAVGDDWQSIFSYAGARIDLFKDFNRCLKNAESIAIENTYRNSQELIDVAGDFILKNEYQIRKKLKSKKHLNNPVELVAYNDDNFFEIDNNRSKIVDKIIELIYNKNPKSRILLLGRYARDIYNIQNEELFSIKGDKIQSKRNPTAILDFLTIHKAKGLGYDYCILLNLSDDKYGFPSKIEDEPIVKLIRPKTNEIMDYAEERRLFYVALTRTKNKIYMLVPKSKESIFAKEIENYKNVKKLYQNTSKQI